MAEIHIKINTRQNIDTEKIGAMVKELSQLGVWNEHCNIIEYDDNDAELTSKIKDVFDKYEAR